MVRLYRTSRLSSLLEVGLVGLSISSGCVLILSLVQGTLKGVRVFSFKAVEVFPQFRLPALCILIDEALFQLYYELILIHTGRSGTRLWEASIVENVLDTNCPLQSFRLLSYNRPRQVQYYVVKILARDSRSRPGSNWVPEKLRVSHHSLETPHHPT